MDVLPLAVGRTANVYPWGDRHVVKMFHSWVSTADIEDERRKALATRALGLPTPAVGHVLRHGNENGLVYERVDGITMSERLMRNPEQAESLACLLAELHAAVHGNCVSEAFPDQVEVLAAKIDACNRLPERKRKELLKALNTMPRGNRLCHGDFHPDNVMLSDAGPQIIDWVDATRGSPLADVARTSIVLRGHMVQQPSEAVRAQLMRFHEAYISTYLETTSDSFEEYHHWLPLVAAARLYERLHGQTKWLLSLVYGSAENT